ncbi:hypothetical protein T492DRAFT_865299, partial [Pavlovales sp. CCMP2436]
MRSVDLSRRYSTFGDEVEAEDEYALPSPPEGGEGSFNTRGGGSSMGSDPPSRRPSTHFGRGADPLALLLVHWRDEESGGGFTPGAEDALAPTSAGALGLLRAFARGLVFPLYIGHQLGRVPLLASFGPWALALALPFVYLASAPHGPESVTAVEGFGPVVLLLVSTHLASISVAGTGHLSAMQAISFINLTMPGGRARRANEVALDIRARASRWKAQHLFSCPFTLACVALGVVHAAFPALQREWLGQTLLGVEADGLATPSSACVAVGAFLASCLLFANFIFFGRLYLLGLHELAGRWEIFARLTPCLWPAEVNFDAPSAALLENGAAWVRIRALLRADTYDVSMAATLYFGSALALLTVQWLFLVPRLLARADSMSYAALLQRRRDRCRSRVLDAELRPYGGGAGAGPDDVRACGPPWIVFAAMQRFHDALFLRLGLVVQPSKCECWINEAYIASLDAHRGLVTRSHLLDGALTPHYGVMCYGLPIGSEEY